MCLPELCVTGYGCEDAFHSPGLQRTARFGYNVFYWSEVLRAGEQVDLNINTTQIPPGDLDGDPAPLFPFRSTDFWAHGFNLGVEYKF